MRMSTRGRFGLRALLHLAVCEKGATISVAKLSKKMGVSSDYLMQLLVRLRQEGVVKSIRGPRGGFRLAKLPAKITVGDVVRAVEGPIVVTDCLMHSGQIPRSRGQTFKPCAKRAHCVARLVWQKLSADIATILDGVTLQNVIDDARRKGLV